MMVENKNKVLIDASAMLSFLFKDESTPQETKLAFEEFANYQLEFIAPLLLKSEVGNALRSAVLQKRLTEAIAKKLFNKFLQIPVTYIKTLDLKQILTLSIKTKLSFYDATYLHTAHSFNLELLTLDKKLKKLAS